MTKGRTSFEKDLEFLKDKGFFSREKAIGKDAHRHLLRMDGKRWRKVRKTRKRAKKKHRVKYICLYCGDISRDIAFSDNHKCQKPMIARYNYWIKPVIKHKVIVTHYVVRYCKTDFRFQDRASAILFRKLVSEEKPFALKKAIEHPDLKWFDKRSLKKFRLPEYIGELRRRTK